MIEIEVHIREWIEKISTVRPELKGFSVCPYASTSNYHIIKCDADDIIPLKGYDVVFYVVEDYFDLDSILFWVNYYNTKYTDYVFLEDFSSYDTFINGVQTNNGRYNLILMQNREKLRKHRQILHGLGYYKTWNDEMLREILADDYDIVKTGIATP